MRIAFAIWKGRISPVFDHSQRLLLVEVEEGIQLNERVQTLLHRFPSRRVAQLRQLQIQTLICGAISRPLAALINASDIKLIPFVAGDVKTVLDAFLAGKLPGPGFWMPGCGRGLGRGRGRENRRFRGGRGSWQTR
jgi:predicted Fe-Mo cluster-binding NifX family protein